MLDTILYIIAFVIPLLLVPMLMPLIALMAHRIKLTDNPNFRKLQRNPVAVMGGMVVVGVICFTLVCMDMFVSMDRLFPAMCVIVILFVVGMVDDTLDLKYSSKLVLQIFIVTLLFIGGRYRATDLGGFLGIHELPLIASYFLSLFLGLYYINALNFIDGIDGLSSGLGALSSAFIALWCVQHGVVEHALMSLSFCGALIAFFFFNVFSKKYKMYMGDSGSLVLGVYAYMSACMDPNKFVLGDYVTDQYIFSFTMAIFSAPLFDLARVCFCRVLDHKSPFKPDRTHLHHLYVDMGYTHFVATLYIIAANALVLGVWYLTAWLLIPVFWQTFSVGAMAFISICLPYFVVDYQRKNKPELYEARKARAKRISASFAKLESAMTHYIDGKKPASNG